MAAWEAGFYLNFQDTGISLMIYYFAILFSFLTTCVFSATKDDTIVLQKVKKILDEEITKLQIPGLAVAFFDGQQEYFMSYGYADFENKKLISKDTLFKIASITKVFTSTLLAVKVIEGKVNLNDSVSKFLNLKNAAFGDNDIGRITLLNLATHTSSLPRPFPSFGKNNPLTKENLNNYLNLLKTPFPVASKYSYSNFGFGLLGLALSNESNTTYMKLLSDVILQPLKMNSTMIEVPENLVNLVAVGYNKNGLAAKQSFNTLMPGSGALYSTSSDMLKFLMANLGINGPKNLLNAMEFAQKGFFSINEHLSIGLGWQRFTKDKGLLIIDKNGGLPGFSSYIGFTKGVKKIGIVILINKRSINASAIGRKILYELQ